MGYALEPFKGPVWRMLHPAWQHSPFSGEGARRYGGRWNMKGWPALYLACDPATAVAEYYRGLPKPGMLAPHQLDAAHMVDLTGGDPHVAEALASDWDAIWRRDGQVPPSWALAQQLIAAGAEGALVPSAQNRGGTNLVLWRWRGADGSGDGATLTLLDPEAALAGRR